MYQVSLEILQQNINTSHLSSSSMNISDFCHYLTDNQYQRLIVASVIIQQQVISIQQPQTITAELQLEKYLNISKLNLFFYLQNRLKTLQCLLDFYGLPDLFLDTNLNRKNRLQNIFYRNQIFSCLGEIGTPSIYKQNSRFAVVCGSCQALRRAPLAPKAPGSMKLKILQKSNYSQVGLFLHKLYLTQYLSK
ncbi:Hypothetical_protein [Hexamita inflata]|uniref:Hypothetical_protein n=1 Tax=Hexamita inflata TaxID=28002 RepID=A0AA86PFP7_9EUKA|nr:Hypothetical protein HINF_LOCUS25999 [Hexamita inflata]